MRTMGGIFFSLLYKKLLEHSYAEQLELPIGRYSEEAQRAQNKELRKARSDQLDHSC